jgi:hypothetical protein
MPPTLFLKKIQVSHKKHRKKTKLLKCLHRILEIRLLDGFVGEGEKEPVDKCRFRLDIVAAEKLSKVLSDRFHIDINNID